MSILLVLVALVALVFVGGAVIGVYFVMRGDSSADRGRLVTATNAQLGERATDVAFVCLDVQGALAQELGRETDRRRGDHSRTATGR